MRSSAEGSRPFRYLPSPDLLQACLVAAATAFTPLLAEPSDISLQTSRNAQYLYREGVKCYRDGNLGEAIVHFKWALDLEPDHAWSLFALARIYQEEYEQTMDLFEYASDFYDKLNTVLQQMPPSADDNKIYISYYYHGLLDLMGGQYSHAFENLKTAVELIPDLIDMPKAYNAIGVSHYYLHQYEEAARSFRMALDADPSYDLANFNLWSVSTRLFLINYIKNLLEESDDPHGIIHYMDRLRRILPSDAQARALEARMLSEMGDKEEALRVLDELVKKNKTDLKTWSWRKDMANICLELGRRDRARTLVWENFRLFPHLAAERGQELLDLLGLIDSDFSDAPSIRHAAKKMANTVPPSDVERDRVQSLDEWHEEFDCGQCHIPYTEEGRPVDCRECHYLVFHIHPVDDMPKTTIPPDFPLGPAGEITCNTCHKLHGGEREAGLLRFGGAGTRRTRRDFCAQCHGRDMTSRNPHRGDLGRERCQYCHTSLNRAKAVGKTTAQACGFCHAMTGSPHPSNSYFFDDPMGGDPLARSGEQDCLTCHEPHGTTFTTHFLKKGIAAFVEKRRAQNPHVPLRFACAYCHTRSSVEEIRRESDDAVRYGGDISQLCVTCHLQEDGHHPMGVKVQEDDIIPASTSDSKSLLSGMGRIDCCTCHDISCRTSEHTMTAMEYNSKNARSDLCWRCHNKRQFINSSPHVDQRKYCRYCHEIPPPARDFKGKIDDVPDGVCFHCHDRSPHPMGADHLRPPTKESVVPSDWPLSATGEVTCITCHEPHAVEENVPKRLRASGRELCKRCHGKFF